MAWRELCAGAPCLAKVRSTAACNEAGAWARVIWPFGEGELTAFTADELAEAEVLAEAGVATAMSAPMMPKTNSTEAMSANRFQPSACLQAILLEPIATHFRQSRTTPTLGSSAGQLLA